MCLFVAGLCYGLVSYSIIEATNNHHSLLRKLWCELFYANEG